MIKRSPQFCKNAIIVTAMPDWNSIVTKFVCATTVSETLSGIEERIATQERPLLETAYSTISLDWKKTKYIKDLLHDRGDSPVGVPVWMDTTEVKSITQASSSDSIPRWSIECDLDDKLFYIFKYALLYNNRSAECEVVELELVGNTIYWKDTLANKEYGDARDLSYNCIVPLAFGKIKIPDTAYLNGAISSIDIDFYERFGIEPWDDVDEYREIYPKAFGDRTALSAWLERPNWDIGEPEQGVLDNQHYDPLDGGSAEAYTAYEANRRELGISWTLFTRKKIQDLLYLFFSKRGRQGVFNIPTWTHDYKVVSIGDDTITIERTFSESGKIDKKYFIYKSGTNIIIEDDNASVDTYNTNHIILNCTDSEIVSRISVGDHLSSFLQVRFEDDALELENVKPTLANVSARFLEYDSGSAQSPSNDEIEIYLYDIGSKHLANYGYNVVFNNVSYEASDILCGGTSFSVEQFGKEISIDVQGKYRADIPATFISENNIIPIKVTRKYGSGSEVVFDGNMVAWKFGDNGRLTIDAISGMYVLERDIPHRVLQRQCVHELYSKHCGLSYEDYLVSGIQIYPFSGSGELSGFNYRIKYGYGGGGIFYGADNTADFRKCSCRKDWIANSREDTTYTNILNAWKATPEYFTDKITANKDTLEEKGVSVGANLHQLNDDTTTPEVMQLFPEDGVKRDLTYWLGANYWLGGSIFSQTASSSKRENIAIIQRAKFQVMDSALYLLVHLNRTLPENYNALTWCMLPYCDGTCQSCRYKFNRYIYTENNDGTINSSLCINDYGNMNNFGGFQNMPSTNTRETFTDERDGYGKK